MKVSRLVILLLIALIAISNLSAQLEQIPLPQDPNLITGKLANGLTYYIIRNAKPEKIAELRLYVDAGSANEDDDQLGMAHFTEHMAFNGTQNYRKSEVVEYLSSIGMGYYNGLNAMTSYDFTMYQLKIPTDNKEQLNKGFHILSDMAYRVSFEPEEIERERGVIIEEWRMGQNANSRVNDILNKVRFAGSRYAQRSPIGTYEVLSTFKHETLKRFYQDWYRPDLQSVVVIGDFVPEEILGLIETYFGVIPAPENPRPVQDFPVPDHPDPRAVVATDPEFPYGMIQLSWKRDYTSFTTLADYHRELAETLCFMMLNDRFQEISRGDNPPYTMAVSHSDNMLKGLANTNLFAITGEGRILQALRVLVSEAERVRSHGFVPSEFERAKTKLISQLEKQVLEMNTRDSDDLVWELFDTLTHGEIYVGPEQTLQLTQALLQMLDISLVNAVIDELITEDNLTVCYASIDRPGMQHPTEAELLAVVTEVRAEQHEAYEDSEISEPLIETIPVPGRVVKETLDKQSGIRKWVLSNGVTVYAKPTTFKADEILFSATSPGGRSSYTPEEMMAASILGFYSDESGFGPFDSNALSKALAGKFARVSFNVDDYQEGISGNAAPKDLETMFQLLYQKATKPRFNNETFTSIATRLRPWIENASKDPQSVFTDTLDVLLYNNHPLKRNMRAEHLDAMQIGQLQKIFGERYADFSDFTFFFVGNFSEAELKQLACTYLANLPAAGRKEKSFDARLRTIQGKKEVRFLRGSSDRSFVSHATSSKYKITPENAVALNAAQIVVNEKLRENIREQLSGVYVIQAWNTIQRFPKPTCVTQILMACSPDRVDELNQAIFATLDSLKAGFIDERYITSARNTMIKRHDENINSNRYWMTSMESNFLNGRPLDTFMGHPARYARLNKAKITKAIKDYMNFNTNRLTVIMLPEAKPEE